LAKAAGAVDFAAGESARGRVNADVLRLDVARRFIDLTIKSGCLDLAALASRA
jgi:hypothetical protein